MAERVVIAGVPRSGKTTLAKRYEATHTVFHTDDLIDTMSWSDTSHFVAQEWMRKHIHSIECEGGPCSCGAEPKWVIEGVAAVRALRKYIRFFADKPCDLAIWTPNPREPLGGHAANMAKGIQTVWYEIKATLVERGVQTQEFLL